MNLHLHHQTRAAFLLGSACLILGAASLTAQDAINRGFYLGVDGGMNLADNLTVPGVGSISFDPGMRTDVSTGYGIKLSDKFTVAPEFELGILYNSFDKVTFPGGSGPASGDLLQMPLLAKGIINWQMTSSLVAYAGGGAGVDYLMDSTAGFIGSESDLAWQLEAGLRYRFGKSELGLGYKYLAFTPSGANTMGNNAIMLSYSVHF